MESAAVAGNTPKCNKDASASEIAGVRASADENARASEGDHMSETSSQLWRAREWLSPPPNS
eukprot:6201929-Pleurochrysis_carterae.AAC.1